MRRTLIRRTLCPYLVALLLVLLLPAIAWAQEQNRAGLVIVHGDGSVVQQCVAFAEESISGYELLQQAGGALSVEAGAMGATVCSIDGEGCSYPAESCFCRCQGSPCVYWSYWRLQADGGWRYQPLGAGNTQVRHGDVEAWRWAEGTTSDAPEPPAAQFDAICAPVPAASAESTSSPPAPLPAELARTAIGQETAAAPVPTANAKLTSNPRASVQAEPAATTSSTAATNLQEGAPIGQGMWLLLAGVVVLPAAVLLLWALVRWGR